MHPKDSRILRWLLAVRSVLHNAWIVNVDYGLARSAWRWSAVDRHGDPLPWYTYPAIEHLAQLDFGGSRVFEYGAGSSTLFWARRAAAVHAVEADARWCREVGARVPPHVVVEHAPEPAHYVDALARAGGGFDVVVIDGAERAACSRATVDQLVPGGLVILDNSDWYPEAAAILRGADLLQVDMKGFGPIVGRTRVTSLFFDRRFQVRPLRSTMPTPSVGWIGPPRRGGRRRR